MDYQNHSAKIDKMNWKFLLIFYLLLFSCGDSKLSPNDKIDTSNAQNSTEKRNILEFKVKEDKHKKDLLDFTVNEILLEEKSENKYRITVKGDLGNDASKIIDKYYLILSIYPYDKNVNLLSADRKKFGFEMFSMYMRISEKGHIIETGREIKTNIKKARAITLSLMQYDPKRKIEETIMLNVNLKIDFNELQFER